MNDDLRVTNYEFLLLTSYSLFFISYFPLLTAAVAALHS